MLRIQVELQNFKPETGLRNGLRIEQFSRLDLIKAAITVGHSKWAHVWKNGASSVFDSLRRVFTIKAALVARNGMLQATPQYVGAEPTDKGQISFCVGNTICALLAQRIADVPWLLNVKIYKTMCGLKFLSGTNMCPDYVGRTPAGKWFVFESKGRSSDFLREALIDAKAQKKMITSVQKEPVHCALASIAYFDTQHQLYAIWDDPPIEEGGSNLEIPQDEYFDVYYRPIQSLLESGGGGFGGESKDLTFLPSIDVHLGLDRKIQEALRNRKFNDLIAFAEKFRGGSTAEVQASEPEKRFPDGVCLRLGPSWNSLLE